MAVKKAMSAKNGGPALKTAPSSKGTAKATPAKTTAARVVRAVRATAARATVAARKVAPARATATKSTATKSTATKATAGKPAAAKATAKKPAAKKPAATKATARKSTAKTTSAPSSRGAARKTTKAAATKVPATAAPLRTHKVAATTTSAAPTPRLRVGKNEKPWTAKELAVVHAALEADVARLRAEISAAESDLAGLMRDAGDGAGDDQADAGTKTFEREQEISLVNNAREVSEQSEHALERILDGSYGICESCGNPIGKNRLLVFPRATLCVPCKSKQERR
jgi:RNA polymerase-binding transcription factor DksA